MSSTELKQTVQDAMDKGITVAEITYCNSISVAEHNVMVIYPWHTIISLPISG